MKIILNIKELLEEGKINQAEYDKLLSLSKTQTGSLALNLLIGFGIIMVCLGVIALTQSAFTALIMAFSDFSHTSTSPIYFFKLFGSLTEI